MKGLAIGVRIQAVLLLSGITACGILRQLGWDEPARPFSHLTHGKEAELECQNCHTKADKEAEAGMPVSLKPCMMCHEGIDEQREPERKLAALVGEKPEWTYVTKLPEDLVFSHKAHFEKKVACAECHSGIETSEGITEEVRVGKDACMKCHAERGAPNDCATCHKEIRKETPPGSHEKNWKKIHGGAAQAGAAGAGRTEDRCGLCHAESACAKCHQEESPRDHTNFWRLKGHGVTAGADRSRCATCHRTDFCDRCHRETAPMNHLGGWGEPADRHCLSCHVPVSSAPSCATCHGGEARHESAPARPTNALHASATRDQCVACHTTLGLPHLDNGDNCGFCHR